MYMPDAVRAMIELMEVDRDRLVHHNAFNVTAMSVTPAMLAAEIQRHVPGFDGGLRGRPGPPGHRGLVARLARRQRGACRVGLVRRTTTSPAMTADMLDKLKARSRPAE